MGDSTPQTSPTGVLPTGCSSLWILPVWVPSTGVSPSAAVAASVWIPHRLTLGHSLLLASTCSGMGSSRSCRWISAPPWTSKGLQGPSPWAAPWASGESQLQRLEHFLTSLCTDLGVCRAVPLSCSHFSFPAAVVQQFLPFLNFPTTTTTVVVWLRLGQQQVYLGAGWNRLLDMGKAPGISKATLVSPLPPTPCHTNPLQLYAFLFMSTKYGFIWLAFFLTVLFDS